MDLAVITEILASTLRMAVPLIVACIAGLWSERSGIVDIGLEGKMLIGAFVAASVAAGATCPDETSFCLTRSIHGIPMLTPVLALLAAMAASILFGLIHGYASISHRGNQVVSGVAINMLAVGLTIVVGHSWFNKGGRTPDLEPNLQFTPIPFPGRDALFATPVLGPISKVFLDHSILTYVAIGLVPLTAWVFAKTRFGLRLRAVGENPQAVDTAGISVSRLRYQAVIIAAALCGLSGAYLSIGLQGFFTREMSAGRGFVALTALIFANWRAWPALWTCLMFGFLQAVANIAQGAQIGGVTIPVQVFIASPYVMTIILLAGFKGLSTPPKASGIPYSKDR